MSAAKSQQETDAPFGAKKRDWTLLYRGFVLFFSILSAGGITVAIYAGTSYVRAQAREAVKEEIRPVNDETFKRFADYVLTARYEGDQRLGASREAEVMRRVEMVEATAKINRDRIDSSQREMIERMHQLEVLMREGFAKQGVQLSPAK